jgi:hypothetical protein
MSRIIVQIKTGMSITSDHIRCDFFSEVHSQAPVTARAASTHEITLISMVVYLPDTTKEIPHESAVVRLVLIATAMLQVVSDGRVDVAVNGETLLPVVLAVLLRALLEVLGNLQEHGLGAAAISANTESRQRLMEMLGIIALLKQSDSIQREIRVDFRGTHQMLGHHQKRQEIASPLPFFDIANRAGAELPALTRINNHLVLLPK